MCYDNNRSNRKRTFLFHETHFDDILIEIIRLDMDLYIEVHGLDERFTQSRISCVGYVRDVDLCKHMCIPISSLSLFFYSF